MTATAIERTPNQRLEALHKANMVRFARALLKRSVNAGTTDAAGVIAAPTPMLAGMKVRDLLLAQRGWGVFRVDRILGRARISHAKTIGGLSDRQRRELLTMLGAE